MRLLYFCLGKPGPSPAVSPGLRGSCASSGPPPPAEIGEANLSCITFSGTGYSGAVGQTFENAVNVDWPRIDAMANYTRYHQLGNRNEQGDIRSQTRPESRLMEVRPGLAGRHADSNGDTPDTH